MMDDTRLSAADVALIKTIYNPPRARRPWMLRDALPEGPSRFFSLGRWALVDALLACGVRAGDRVLVPGLICREVLASLSVVGASPLFYSMSRELSADLGPSDTASARAIIAVNYFGFPQDLTVFRDYCRRTGAALIEDNAHGMLSRDSEGQLLGGRGDAGIFSFRKTIAVPDGAALVLTRGRELPPAVRDAADQQPSPRYAMKQAFRRAAGRLDPGRVLQAIGVIRTLRKSITGDAVPVSPPDAEARIPVSPNPGPWVTRPIGVAEPELETARRRDLYDVARRIAEAAGAVSVFSRVPPNAVPYGFPFFASSAHAPRIAAEVRRHGFQLCQWPDLPFAVRPSAPEHYGQLMVLPFLW